MKTKIKQKVLARFEEGAERSEIVREFYPEGVAQATIYRWIDEYNSLNGLDEDELDDEEYENEEDEEEISGSVNLAAKLKNSDQEHKDILRKQRRALKTAKTLFKEISSHSSGHEWNRKQLKRMHNSLDAIQEDIEELCDFDKTQYESLALWVFVEKLGDLFGDLAAAGSSITLELDTSIEDYLQDALLVIDFDDEFDYHNYFGSKLNRVSDLLSEYDGSKIDEATADELRGITDQLIEDIEEVDWEQDELLHDLKAVSRDLKKVSNKAAASFWGTALFDLDDEISFELSVEEVED